MTIKVKKIKNKSQACAMKDYNLTDNQYKQVMQFINDNAVPSDASINVEISPDGDASISIINPGSAECQQPKQATHAIGDYVTTTLEPGKTPLIQGSTTNSSLSKILGAISICSAFIACICQACGLIFFIQDRNSRPTEKNNKPEKREQN